MQNNIVTVDSFLTMDDLLRRPRLSALSFSIHRSAGSCNQFTHSCRKCTMDTVDVIHLSCSMSKGKRIMNSFSIGRFKMLALSKGLSLMSFLDRFPAIALRTLVISCCLWGMWNSLKLTRADFSSDKTPRIPYGQSSCWNPTIRMPIRGWRSWMKLTALNCSKRH